jgi:methylmalonyl-CoA mutase, N-terminal domain
VSRLWVTLEGRDAEVDFHVEDGRVWLDVEGRRIEADVRRLPDGEVYSLLVQGASYEVRVSPGAEALDVTVRGVTLPVEVRHPLEKRLRAAARAAGKTTGETIADQGEARRRRRARPGGGRRRGDEDAERARVASRRRRRRGARRRARVGVGGAAARAPARRVMAATRRRGGARGAAKPTSRPGPSPAAPSVPPRTTPSWIALRPAYFRADLPADLERTTPAPGEPPYTRGIHPTMYRSRLWTMRQYAGFNTARETNERFRYLLAQGQTGLSVAFDLPTQMGYDSDHPRARGEVGKAGVAISCLADMDALLAELPLDRITTSMTINATAPLLLAFYVAVADARGVPRAKLGGTIQNDVLKEYAARGTYIYPPAPSLRLITDVFEFATREVPEWNTISVSGYHVREAGCTAVQELAFTLGNGLEYLRAARDRDLEPAPIARRMSFFFNGHNHLLEEIAKFRAARRLWAELLRDRFGVADREALKLRFHTQTAGSTLTAQQPLNNVVRVTVQALAAVLGGTQSLHTNGYDEALGLPSREAATLALRTQQILAHESGVTDAADPLAGSYLIEHLTDELARRARALIEQVDGLGGMLAAIESGWVQTQIHEAAYRWHREVETGARTVVGVNRFADGAPPAAPPFTPDPRIEAERGPMLARWRAERDAPATANALARLERGARGDDNLVPPILAALVAGATLGEVCDTMRGVFGEHRPGGAS